MLIRSASLVGLSCVFIACAAETDAPALMVAGGAGTSAGGSSGSISAAATAGTSAAGVNAGAAVQGGGAGGGTAGVTAAGLAGSTATPGAGSGGVAGGVAGAGGAVTTVADNTAGVASIGGAGGSVTQVGDAAGAAGATASGAGADAGGMAGMAAAGGTVAAVGGAAGMDSGTEVAGAGGSETEGMGGASGEVAQGGATGDGEAGASGESGCASAAICDDFESGISAEWTIQPDSNPAPEVDTSMGANGSAASLKIVGTSQQSFVAYEVPAQAFYTRSYMNFEQTTEQMNGHGWFIVAADNVTSGNEQQMRFGSSGNHGHKEIDFNVYGPTCGGEKTQFSDGGSDGLAGWENTPYESVLFSANTWYCVETFFNGPGHEFQVWIDGEEVPGLHVTEETMCAAWAPTYTHIKFGAGANGNIGAIWYDDIGVSTSRIGCD